MSTNEQTPLSHPTSVMRNTLRKEQVMHDVGKLTSDEALREYCDKNYHQIIPIIAEKEHRAEEGTSRKGGLSVSAACPRVLNQGMSTNACNRDICTMAITFLRYIDTRPNGDALWKCILKGPYTPMIVTTPAVPAIEDSPAGPEQITLETVMNMTPENRAHFESEKEAIHLILTGIGR
ncbi:hypothetical protein Tco_1402451 [Tanacetum coccineum]